METIEFNEVIKQNIEVVGGLLPRVSLEKDGLSTSLMYKYIIPTVFRAQMDSSGYIQLAKIPKSKIMYIANALIMRLTLMPVVNCVFIASIHMNGSSPSINIVEISHSTNAGLIKWFYKEDDEYLYFYMNGRDINIVRTILLANNMPYLGDIINLADPGGLVSVSTIV